MYPYGCGCGPSYPCGGYGGSGTGIIWIIIVIAILFFIFFGNNGSRKIY